MRFFPQSNVVMIKDKYRGKIYYGLRMYEYDQRNPIVSKNGFNLTPIEMKAFIKAFAQDVVRPWLNKRKKNT